MSAASADRNLLFGILAVQLDFVTKDSLIVGMNAWLLDKPKSLGDILRDQGQLSPDRLVLLTALVAEHLKQHDNDPQKSLAVLPSVDPWLIRQLASVDEAMQESIAAVPSTQGDPKATGPQPPTPPAASRYRILRPHARGGLGEISIAEDTELHREVALKEIQPRFAADRAARERFVLEAEVTGNLEHPGIVPVYGLGANPTGRPFYAMRFIKGDSLLDAVKRFHSVEPPRLDPAERGLALRDLLGRFVAVCQAVAYAHSRGVVHRDLKPANVMLGKFGETLVVDWGLAKTVGRPDPAADGETTLRPGSGSGSAATLPGSVLGTPAFMAPEQADGRLGEVGPAADIYSLGATLYSLLTGQAPFGGPMDEVLEQVKKGKFKPPRLVSPVVPRALEAVCLKAMALAPSGRYDSAQDLASDVQRWLADEPVRAYREPPSARAWRWVRNHRLSVTGATAALVVGVVALGVSTMLLSAANEQTKRMAQTATATADFLTGLFQATDPIAIEYLGARGARQNAANITAGELLKQGRDRLNSQHLDDPIKAAVLDTIGNVYRSIGLLDQAEPLLQEGLALRRQRSGNQHEDVATSLFHLGWLRQDEGRFPEAEALYRESLDIRKARYGPDDLRTTVVMLNLAWALALRYDEPSPERLNEAEDLVREVVRIRSRQLGERHRDVGLAKFGLAALTLGHGNFQRGREMLDEAIEILDRPENKDPAIGFMQLYISAAVERKDQRYEEAARLHRKALDAAQQLLGEQHPLYIILLGDYAGLLRTKGDMAAAEKEARRALELSRRSPLRWHLVTLNGLVEYGDALRGRRDLQEAESVYREALDVARRLNFKVKVDQIEAKLAALHQLPAGKDAGPPRTSAPGP